MATERDFVAMPISEYEGEFARPAAVAPAVEQATPGMAPVALQPQPAGPTALFTAPASPLAPEAAVQRRRAGLGLLLAVGAAGAGAALAGPWGAGAGLLLLGATRNVFRAQQLWALPEGRAEAGRSGTVALVGLGVGGYCAYRAYQSRKAE